MFKIFNSRRHLRRRRFEITMTILEVSNFPEMGVLAVKYRDEHGNTGITERAAIDTATHTAVWNQTYNFVEDFFYDIHTNDVKKCDMHLSVRHITPGSQKETKIGIVNINLSEFLDSQEKTRAFLLQRSRSNCSVKVTVESRQIDGGPI